MVDRPDENQFDDWHDRIGDEFARLDLVEPPDVWSTIGAGDPGRAPSSSTAPPRRRHRRRRWVAAAAALVAALGVAALSGTIARDREPVVVASAGTRVPEPTNPPAPSSTQVPLPSIGVLEPERTECDRLDLARRLGAGMPSFSYAPSESLQSVVSRSKGAVWGEIWQIDRESDGSLISFKKLGALGDGDQVRSIWTPATMADTDVGALFVAFLSGIADAGREATAPEAWVPDIEGLWVGCGPRSPAASVLVTPAGESWDQLLDAGVTLNDLWLAAHVPAGEIVTDVSGDLIGDGSRIFDLQLTTGDRFRLAIPSRFTGDSLQMTEPPVPGPITLTTTDLVITIGPGCPKPSTDHSIRDQTTIESIPTLSLANDQLTPTLCWAHQPVGIVVEPQGVVFSIEDTPAADAGPWDLRVISAGHRYSEAFTAYSPYDPNCSSCQPAGPLRYDVAGPDDVIVHTIGNRVAAIDGKTLEALWTVPFGPQRGGGPNLRLHGLREAVIVDVVDGPLVALDPQTGSEQWTVERLFGERLVGLSRHSEDGPLLVRSSFVLEGDDAAPVLRRIDAITGEVIWAALGSQGKEWAPWRPELFDDVVIMLEAGRPGVDEGAARVWAFELDTGAPIWSQSLFGLGDRVQEETLAQLEFETGRALVLLTGEGDAVRLDPATGAIMFRQPVGAASISGTEHADDGSLALALDTSAGLLLLDQFTGEVVAG